MIVDASTVKGFVSLLRLNFKNAMNNRLAFSKSTVQFIELIKSAVMSAAKIDSESAAGRLLQTARNAVQLFICIAPRYHQTQISSVPQIAGEFVKIRK